MTYCRGVTSTRTVRSAEREPRRQDGREGEETEGLEQTLYSELVPHHRDRPGWGPKATSAPAGWTATAGQWSLRSHHLVLVVSSQSREVGAAIISPSRGTQLVSGGPGTGHWGNLCSGPCTEPLMHSPGSSPKDAGDDWKSCSQWGSGTTDHALLRSGQVRMYKEPTVIYSPSQTDGLGRYPEYHGHASPLPDESRWRGRRT